MKKNLFKKGIAMALSLVLLAGCSGGTDNKPAEESSADGAASETSSAGDSSGNASGEEITLSYACWDTSQAPVYEELFRKFEAENPGIKVETDLSTWKDYWTKLETSITGKNAPDVFWLNIPRSKNYIINDVLLPLDELNVEFDKLPAHHVEAYSNDGKVYGVPKDYDTMGLWYNKKLFDEAGVEYPTDSWTWDDLKAAAEKLTDVEKGIYGFGAPLTWQGGYYEAIYQNGGYAFTEDGLHSGFNDPKTIGGVKFWADLTFDGVSPPVVEFANATASEVFQNGKIAMFFEGSYLAPKLFQEADHKDDYDVAMMPKGGEKIAGTSNSLAHVVYAESKHPEAAKKLVEFLSTKESNIHVAESGVVIPAYEGSQEAWVNAFPDKNAQVFIDMAEHSVSLPNALHSSAVITMEQEVLAQAWSKEITIEEACAKIYEQAEGILQAE